MRHAASIAQPSDVGQRSNQDKKHKLHVQPKRLSIAVIRGRSSPQNGSTRKAHGDPEEQSHVLLIERGSSTTTTTATTTTRTRWNRQLWRTRPDWPTGFGPISRQHSHIFFDQGICVLQGLSTSDRVDLM